MQQLKSQIQVSVDAYTSPVESAMVHNYIANTYVFPVTGIPTTPNAFKEFCKDLKEHFDYEESVFDVSASNKTYVLEQKDVFLINAFVEGLDEVDITIYADSAKRAEFIYNLIKPYQILDTELNIKFDSYYLSDRGSLEVNTAFKNISDFQGISKLYYPYLDTDEMFRQYLLSSESLLLLSADTGLGKSKIVDLLFKYYLENTEVTEEAQNINIVYVKNTEILSKDSFWTKLSKANADLVVLDDVDFMLISREHSDKSYSDDIRNKFISQFLSFSDGLTKNKTKFIVTTNQNIDSIDKAILRKGRCFDILKFRELKKEEALDIWNESKLDESFNKHFLDDNIKACDLGSKIELFKKMKQKNAVGLSEYIKEEGISVYNKNESKTISF